MVTAVSGYAQEFLSQVHHPEAHRNGSGLVQLQKIDNNRHRLIVQPQMREQQLGSDSSSTPAPIEIDLTTVQLFDLVEAVDQFFADSQTLPDLSLQLSPVSKRHTRSGQQLVKQAVPATVGATSLALAAIAFFLVPIPEVRRPAEAESVNQTTAPAITNQSQVIALNQKLYDQLNQAWTTRATLEQDLIYRVSVAANGAIIGYKPVNPAASTQIGQTPLPRLLSIPATGRGTTQEPLAQFRVVFSNNGELQVTPWDVKN